MPSCAPQTQDLPRPGVPALLTDPSLQAPAKACWDQETMATLSSSARIIKVGEVLGQGHTSQAGRHFYLPVPRPHCLALPTTQLPFCLRESFPPPRSAPPSQGPQGVSLRLP